MCRPQSAAAALISALLSCSQSFHKVWTVCPALTYITGRKKRSAVYLSAFSPPDPQQQRASLPFLPSSVAVRSGSAGRQLVVAVQRIIVGKSNGGLVSPVGPRSFYVAFLFVSLLLPLLFLQTMCWKKIRTLLREREEEKSCCVFTSHPVSEEEEEEGRVSPLVCDIWELEGNLLSSPENGATKLAPLSVIAARFSWPNCILCAKMRPIVGHPCLARCIWLCVWAIDRNHVGRCVSASFRWTEMKLEHPEVLISSSRPCTWSLIGPSSRSQVYIA